MPVIDDRGRVFGKVNLIDAIVGLFVLVMVPIGYGAYALFRVPVPAITAVEPRSVVEKVPATLKIVGRDLRPFLRAQFGPFESAGFLIQSPTLAEIKVPATLPAGTYDLTIYDEAQELVREAGALTVAPAAASAPRSEPSVVVQVSGLFLGLSHDDLNLVRAGTKLGPETEILTVGAPQPLVERLRIAADRIMMVPLADQSQVPAVLRLRCRLVDEACWVGPERLELEEVLSLPLLTTEAEGRSGLPPAQVRFRVRDVRTLR